MLADPFSLGGEVAAWQPPEVPPETAKLRAAVVELDQGLRPATPGHMQWCINKLFVLPTRDGSAVTAAFAADNFIDACGHFPDDLWSAGTLELLQTKTFRPSPAELVAAIGAKYRERQRMLERVNLMLGGRPTEGQKKPFVREAEDVRLRALRDSLVKIGKMERAAVYERDLAAMENRSPEEWAVADGAPLEPIDARDDTALPPELSPGMQARTLRSLAKVVRTVDKASHADFLERKADEISTEERSGAWKAGEPVYQRGMSWVLEDLPTPNEIPESVEYEGEAA